MVSLANQILSKVKDTESEALEIFTSIRKWYLKNGDTGTKISKPVKVFEMTDKEQLDEQELDNLLSIYAAWIGYYQYFVVFYKGLAEHLDNLYDTCTAEYRLHNPADAKGKRAKSIPMMVDEAKRKYAPLRRAEQMARNHHADYKTKSDMASIQHSLVSRVISMRSDELKAFK